MPGLAGSCMPAACHVHMRACPTPAPLSPCPAWLQDLGGLSMEELEAELSRRKTAAAAGGAKPGGQGQA